MLAPPATPPWRARGARQLARLVGVAAMLLAIVVGGIGEEHAESSTAAVSVVAGVQAVSGEAEPAAHTISPTDLVGGCLLFVACCLVVLALWRLLYRGVKIRINRIEPPIPVRASIRGLFELPPSIVALSISRT